MAYLSKECILNAYREIKESCPKADISNFSSLQYFIAADRFYKCNNNPCDSGLSSNKNLFISYVKDVIELDDGHYFKSLKEIYEGSKSINGTVSSNFFSGSSVQDSGRTSGVKYPYPAKTGQSLIYAEDKKIFVSDDYYPNIEMYLNATEKVALAIWVLRKVNRFESLSIGEFRNILGEYYTQRMVDTLLNCSEEEWSDIKDSLMIESFNDIATIMMEDIIGKKNNKVIHLLSHQQIFYGAPGTGKSNKVKEQTAEAEKEGRVFRTTFHPDSDYSTFVGCYKPTMKLNVISKNGVETKEEQIVYRFVPQAFTNAYVKAWSTTEDVYLVIEEINRGNCAQIFGDLFQLLDRKDGVSEYPINADSDLRDNICKALETSERTDFPDGVKEGKKLVLPSNFYIWATMNTSDQSLFPIDSAFKRRWDWVYMPIDTKKENWHIKVGGDL